MSKNNPKLLSMNLLPIVLIVALILGAGFLLIEGDVKLPWAKKDNTFSVRRLEGFPTTSYTDQQLPKQRLVIKSQKELEDFLKAADPSGNLALGEKIDFDKEYLLGVSSETVDTQGYGIKVRKVYIDDQENRLLASIRQTIPGENCTYDIDPNIPVDLVAVEKTEKDVEFESIKEFAECN